jgi:exosortase/archaeosortase family protein
LYPLIRVLLALLPHRELALLNGQIIRVILTGGAIEILEGCNGLTTVLQLFLVTILFLIASPMRPLWSHIVLAVAAALLGLLLNAVRLALLSLINASAVANPMCPLCQERRPLGLTSPPGDQPNHHETHR